MVRAAQSSADVKAVVELTGACFPEECGTLFSKGGAGLTLQQWRALEEEDLTRQPWLWPSTGALAAPAVWSGGAGWGRLGAGWFREGWVVLLS